MTLFCQYKDILGKLNDLLTSFDHIDPNSEGCIKAAEDIRKKIQYS